LGVKARIKAVVDVSFGLGLALLAVATGIRFDVTEVIMNNTNAFAACVWCGASLLRGPVVVKLQPKREAPRPWRFVLPKREREGSTPSPRTSFVTKLFVEPGPTHFPSAPATWSDEESRLTRGLKPMPKTLARGLALFGTGLAAFR